MEMLRQNPVNEQFDYDYEEKMKLFVKNIFNTVSEPFDKDPLSWDTGIKSAKELLSIQDSVWYKMHKKINKIKRP